MVGGGRAWGVGEWGGTVTMTVGCGVAYVQFATISLQWCALLPYSRKVIGSITNSNCNINFFAYFAHVRFT